MKRVPDDLSRKLLAASDKMPDGSGFDVSIEDVAKLAGIPRATIYYYFSGKDDLIDFYLNDLLDRTRAAIQKAASTEGDMTERLTAVMTAMIGAYAEYPKMCLELPAAIGAAGERAAVMHNMERSVLAPFREVLLEGRSRGELTFPDAVVAADAISGALHMVSMKALVTTGTIDVEQLSESVVPVLVNGLISG